MFWLRIALSLVAVFAPAVAGAQGRPGTPVGVAAVVSEEVQEQRLITGEIAAVRRSRVAAREAGLVIEYAFLEADLARAGDVIARLDTTDFQNLIAELNAEKLVQNALLAERKAAGDLAEQEYEIILTLFNDGDSNPIELLNAKTARSMAQARIRETEQQLNVLDARIATLNSKLERADVIAPFDGIIIARHTEVGEWLGVGDPVVDLLSTTEFEVRLDVPARYFVSVQSHTGNIAVTIEATGATRSIKNRRIVPQLAESAQTFALILPIENMGGDLAPGMAVTAWVPVSGRSTELVVPRDAIMRNEIGAYVYAVRASGPEAPPQAVPVPVAVLFPVGDNVVVRSPSLAPGDRVVVEGNERLMPQMPVAPINSGAPSDDTGGDNVR